MEVILNIGLDGIPAGLSYTNGKLNPLNARQALTAVQALRAHGMQVKASKVFQSDTEPTMVAVVVMTGHDSYENTRALHQTAADLQQACIAVYTPRVAFGALVGPHAAAWGAFNPELFIMPDGTRLSQPAVQVAA